MPESPVSGGFSVPPPGKGILSAAEMQDLVKEPLKKAAQILGGTVDGVAVDPPDTGQKVADRYKDEEPPMEVDQEDRRSYIRSLLAKEPFTKVYQLFGGALKLAFRTRSSAEADQVFLADLQDRLKVRLKLSLIGIEIVKDDRNAEPTTVEQLDDVAVSAVYDVFKSFEALCDELFRRANDPDFWTGTAGRT